MHQGHTMHNYLNTVLNVYIYSSIHIGICVAAMIFQTYYIIGIPLIIDNYILFCFFSTLLTYTLHKIVGVYHVKTPNIGIRIHLFKTFHLLFKCYALLILPFFLFYLFSLESRLIKLLLIPGIISLLYVFPMDKSGRRLRDYAYIKVFLIAVVWVIITVIIPMVMNVATLPFLILTSLEKLLFMVALTLPFDIRDIYIDKTSGVKTLAADLGVKKTYKLSFILVLAAILVIVASYILGYISFHYLVIIILAYAISLIIIHFSLNKTHDFYFAGLVDGMMILPFLFILISQLVFK